MMEDWLRLARSGCVDIDIFLVTKAMNRDCSRDYSALGLRERSFEDFFASLQLRTLLPGLSSRAHSTRMSSCFLPALSLRVSVNSGQKTSLPSLEISRSVDPDTAF